jgi:hypothetical protein
MSLLLLLLLSSSSSLLLLYTVRYNTYALSNCTLALSDDLLPIPLIWIPGSFEQPLRTVRVTEGLFNNFNMV